MTTTKKGEGIASCIVHLADSAKFEGVTSNKRCSSLTGLCFESPNNTIHVTEECKYDELKPEDLILWDLLDISEVKIKSGEELENTFFIEFVKEAKTGYKQRVLFYAQTQYLLCAETFRSQYFSDWMRVVRNIVQNAPIDSAGAFIGAIALINELSEGCANIYDFLNNQTIKRRFASDQVEEEKLKAKLIQTDSRWKPQIFKVEDDSFLKGEIRFLIDFAKAEDGYDYQKFKDLSDNFLLLFSSKDDLLRVA
jgi:hypothetical protein